MTLKSDGAGAAAPTRPTAAWRTTADTPVGTASVFAARLGGALLPAVPVPHRADGAFDAEAQHAYARWMASQPVAGVAVWAHTGRGLCLAPEVAGHVLSSWREAIGPDRLLVAGAGARPKPRPSRPSVRITPSPNPEELSDFVVGQTVEMARQAKRLGADAILALPPALLTGLEDGEDRVVAVHEALGEVGLPVVAFYLYEGAGGMAYSPDLVRRVLALPHVVGIKVATLDSVITFQEIAALLAAEFSGRVLVSGEDRFLGYSLLTGATAALVGLGAALTGMQADLLAAHAAREHARFTELCHRCDRFARATFREPMEGYIRRMLWALAAQGVIPREATFDPWGPEVPEEQLAEVERVVRELQAG